jgi:hypothetical protein
MAVDFLRSCYRINARMVAGSEATRTIRWYFCDPGAKLLPFPSAFGSNVWEYPERDLAGVGEADRVRSFDSGHNRGFPGLSFQGEPSWFANGIPAAELLNPIPLTLCGTRTQSAVGGVELDGEAHMMDNSLDASGGLEADGAGHMMDNSLDASGGVELDGASGFEVGVIDSSGGALTDGTGFDDVVDDNP